MRILTPVEEKMLSEAQFGLFNVYYIITLKKAQELRDQKFIVTDSHEGKGSPRIHKIDWSQAGVGIFDYENIDKLDENNPKYSFAQRLWIISMKNKPK